MQTCRVLLPNDAEADDTWTDALACRAGRLCQQSEAQTLRRVQMTWGELCIHAKVKGVEAVSLDAVALEDFVYKSHAQTRAFVALRWMAKNMQLAWPMEDVIAPSAKAKSIFGLSQTQAVCALPLMLKALEHTMASRAADKQPGWLGLLAFWIQAVGCMRLKHLKRCVSLRLTESTFHFRCLKGKQRNQRGGFDWAVPCTCVFTKWKWGEAFLEEWHSVTRADPSRICGIVFDTAKRETLTNAACIALAHKALQPVVNNTELLTTYSWRRMQPTLAVASGFTAQEMMALGDWQDKTLAGMTVHQSKVAAVPLRYAANKEAESVRAKHLASGILAEVGGYGDWDTIPPSKCTDAYSSAEIANQVDAAVAANEKLVWKSESHRDERAHRKFVPRDSEQPAAADAPQVPGKLLSQFTRDSQKICGPFQEGKCNVAQSSSGLGCNQGRHICAVLLRSGRVCGSRHGGSTCTNSRAATPDSIVFRDPVIGRLSDKELSIVPNTVVLPVEAVPRAKAMPRAAGGAEKSRATIGSFSSGINEVEATATSPSTADAGEAWGAIFDELARKKATKRGNTFRPEPPTLIAKVDKRPRRGEVWLGGIPSQHNLKLLTSKEISIQVHCFAGSPTEKHVKGMGRGLELPHAVVMQMAVTSPSSRDADWKALIREILTSVMRGDNAYIHCMAGVHRAPLVAAMVRAVLHDEDFSCAADKINAVRQIEMGEVVGKIGKVWIEKALQLQPPKLYPAVQAWTTSNLIGPGRVHSASDSGNGWQPLCQWKCTGQKAYYRKEPVLALSLTEASSWGKEFCRECLLRSPASVRAYVGKSTGDR